MPPPLKEKMQGDLTAQAVSWRTTTTHIRRIVEAMQHLARACAGQRSVAAGNVCVPGEDVREPIWQGIVS